MSARVLVVVLALGALAACGSDGDGPAKKGHHEPRNAKEKQRLEAQKSKNKDDQPDGRKWTGWRYQGSRDECFFVVGRKCFKTENEACSAAHCKAPLKCDTTGGGPATVACKKPE